LEASFPYLQGVLEVGLRLSVLLAAVDAVLDDVNQHLELWEHVSEEGV
jgi:hypothetical protein